eukprot:jgi/Tetstr1/455283/TSEL_042119.t1
MADLVSRAKAIVITKKTRAEYTLPEGVLAFYVTPADRTGITDPSSAAGAASSSSTRSRASTDTIIVMRAEIQAVWPRDDDDVYLPVQGALGEVVAPDWAAGLVVSRVRAAGIEEDEKNMRKRVTRGASRRQGKEAHGGVVDGPASRGGEDTDGRRSPSGRAAAPPTPN